MAKSFQKCGEVSSGGSPYLTPALPTPLTGVGYPSTSEDTIVHNGTLVNNVTFPSVATGVFTGKLADVTVWTVDSSDINASAVGYYGAGRACWYDSVNDRLYVFAYDSGTTPDTLYTAYITVETGAITQVGNVQLSVDLFSTTERSTAVHRDAIDSGNFTLENRQRIVVIDSATGAEVSNVARSPSLLAVMTYVTQDGLTFASAMTEGTHLMQITKGGINTEVPLVPYMLGGDSNILDPIRWGDMVVMLPQQPVDAIFRAFDVTEFDEWLAKMADLGGLA